MRSLAGLKTDRFEHRYAPPPHTHQSIRNFNLSPEVIRFVVICYVSFPLSLRNFEDLLFELGINLCHETVRR